MPKIEVNASDLYEKLDKLGIKKEELARMLESAKGEIDEEDKETVKIELNDTNRPDLWSLEGIMRHLENYHLSKPKKEFKFLPYNGKDVYAKAGVKELRPFIAGFIIRNITVDDPLIRELVQKQEKLTGGYGAKRKLMSIGLYVDRLIKYPIIYKSVPKTTKMLTLHSENEMTLEDILKEHPMGKEYGHIINKHDEYPLLTDSNDDILSFPPIINSNRLGEVKIGDKDLFVEFTGETIQHTLLSCNVFAVDMLERGYQIEPVKIIYGYDTKYGKEMYTPFQFQAKAVSTKTKLKELLGDDLDDNTIHKCLNKMGIFDVEIDAQKITITPPIYRNDFISEVDVCEEVIIGYGLSNIPKILNLPFLKGQVSQVEKVSQKLKDILVGMGYQEMIFNYLGSGDSFVYKMSKDYKVYLERAINLRKDISNYIKDETIVKLENPITKSYEFLRNSGIPSLLQAESKSQNATAPHLMFEIGKVTVRDESANLGTRTYTSLSMLISGKDVSINTIATHITNLMYYLSFDNHKIQKDAHHSLIPGRCAKVVITGNTSDNKPQDKKIMFFGEVHPGVLENFEIGMPTCVAEMFIEDMLSVTPIQNTPQTSNGTENSTAK